MTGVLYKKDLKYVENYVIFVLVHAWVVKAPKVILSYLAVLAAFIFLTYRRVFPFFKKLEIGENEIRMMLLGFCIASLPRKGLHRSAVTIGKTTFAVFSSAPMADMELRALAAAIRKKRVIIYPVTMEMKRDFPSWFGA